MVVFTFLRAMAIRDNISRYMRMTIKGVPGLGVLGLILLGSWKCASTGRAHTARREGDEIHLGARPGEKVIVNDLNRDGKPDEWTYVVSSSGPDGKPVDRIARREFDMNWDGKVDIRRTYDAKGQLQQEDLDLDF